jgi:hypothetical protein
MVQSNQAAACTSAKGPPAFTLGEAGIATPGTTLTLCDSVGNCGESLTTNAAGSTVASQFVGFYTLSPSLTIQPGDTLSISILYTVS